MALTRRERYENQVSRQVEFIRVLRGRTFWTMARRSFAISGGTEVSRAEQLALWVDEYTANVKQPVVILSGTAGFAQSFSRLLYNDYDIYIFDAQHPNYHFFYGMDVTGCSDVIVNLARKQGAWGLQELQGFTQAFMRLTEMTYPVSLPAMVELAKAPDEVLADMAGRCGLDQNDCRILKNGGKAGMSFRDLLKNMISYAGTLMRPDCESLQNILTFVQDSTYKIRYGDNRRKVIIVNALSQYPFFLNICFARELWNVYARGLPCAIVIDAMPLEEDDPLLAVMERASIGGGCAGYSAFDVGAMIRNRVKVSGIPIKCFLRDEKSNCFSADVTDMLQNTGRYMAYQEMRGVTRRMFDLPIDRNHDARVSVQEVSRLMAADITRAGAILKGYNGEMIAVVGRMTADD